MRNRCVVSALALAGALGGCGYGGGSSTGPSTGLLRVVQAVGSASSITVRVDGTLLLTLPAGAVSAPTAVRVGSHTLTLTPLGGPTLASTRSLEITDGGLVTLVARDSSGIVVPAQLADTGAIVPPGASKLRVMHAAALAPALDIYRSQPDFPSLITVMFPFPLGAVSPYLQSTPGSWDIVVTPAGLPDTLYHSGPFTVADGKRVTVVVMDSSAAGGVTATVVAEN